MWPPTQEDTPADKNKNSKGKVTKPVPSKLNTSMHGDDDEFVSGTDSGSDDE
jgi:hypothetical protein